MPTLGRGHLKYRDESDMGSVLVVDDDADSRDVVSRLLGRAGYTVRSAVNGRDALIAVTTAPPDVIILDAMMPEMNGVEFLQVIRSYLRWSTLPVILLTAYPQGPHIDRAAGTGRQTHLLQARLPVRRPAALRQPVDGRPGGRLRVGRLSGAPGSPSGPPPQNRTELFSPRIRIQRNFG